ncbi:hypothetical protein [Paenibacillus sp. sgz500958]|uniref:hypothetical protein n=1 Tax=Paenibacillus sp. sgz500958 TaxID=3242475 RepID=UPI0036D3EE61
MIPDGNPIPEELLQNRYWRGLLFIFMNHSKLNLFLKPDFVDLNEPVVHIDNLKAATKLWSPSDKFMLTAALHLYNGRNKIDLSMADRLDDKNTEILLSALKLRFSG